MLFPVTCLLDHAAPSETFIRREIDQLRRLGWPLTTRYLTGNADTLQYALQRCPAGYRARFAFSVLRHAIALLPRSPIAACRVLKRAPQAAHLTAVLLTTRSRLAHAHFAGITADLCAIAARTLGLPWSCAVHARDVFACRPSLLHRRLRHAAGVIACSQKAADTVTASGIPSETVWLIHHGIPLYAFAFDTIQPSGALMFAGRLQTKKGVDTLLHACVRVMQQGINFTCLIAGDGPERRRLQRLSSQLGLSEQVTFSGWLSQEETRSQIMDASLLVLPSRQLPDGDSDGIANVIVEALALGTPVLTTTAGAAAEVITDQINGLLVPPDDPDQLAAAIVLALQSKEMLLRLGRNGRKSAETLFDLSVNIHKVEQFFRQIVDPASDQPVTSLSTHA